MHRKISCIIKLERNRIQNKSSHSFSLMNNTIFKKLLLMKNINFVHAYFSVQNHFLISSFICSVRSGPSVSSSSSYNTGRSNHSVSACSSSSNTGRSNHSVSCSYSNSVVRSNHFVFCSCQINPLCV